MSGAMKNLEMHKAIIYTEDGSVELAKTTIGNFDTQTNTITVSRKPFRNEPEDPYVSVLIFHSDGLYEYKGTIHKQNSTPEYLEIGLYKGKNRENRGTVRYLVNAPAVVEKYRIANKLMPLREPLAVMVRDVSANGCSIRANPHFLNIGTTFLFQMELSGGIVPFFATAVRATSISKDETEYGCTLATLSTADV